jgi:hypothetical protein
LLIWILRDWIRWPPKTGGEEETVYKNEKQSEKADFLPVKYGKEVKQGKRIGNC